MLNIFSVFTVQILFCLCLNCTLFIFKGPVSPASSHGGNVDDVVNNQPEDGVYFDSSSPVVITTGCAFKRHPDSEEEPLDLSLPKRRRQE